MKKPMAVIGISFFAALTVIGYLSYSVVIYILLSLFILLLILICFKSRNTVVSIFVVASVIAACVLFLFKSYFSYEMTVKYVSQKPSLTVMIIDDAEERDGKFYYTSEIRECEISELCGKKLRLISFEPIDANTYDLVQFTGKLYEIGASNKTTQAQYKSDGIYLSTYVGEKYSVSEAQSKPLSFYLYKLRTGLSKAVNSVLGDTAPIVNAILFGNTRALSNTTEAYFRNAGLSHLLCVSGLHITIISSAVKRLLFNAFRSKRASNITATVIIWLFVALIGFSPSAVRAGIMLTIFNMSVFVMRKSDAINSLGFAVLLICVFDPFAAGSASLIYSFAATLGIIIIPKIKAEEHLPKKCPKIVKLFVKSAVGAFTISMGAMLTTLPVQMLLFNSATIISPISNLFTFFAVAVIVPVGMMGVIMYFISAAASVPFFFVCGVAAKYLDYIARALSSLPFATVDASNNFVKMWIIVFVACTYAFAFRKKEGIAVK